PSRPQRPSTRARPIPNSFVGSELLEVRAISPGGQRGDLSSTSVMGSHSTSAKTMQNLQHPTARCVRCPIPADLHCRGVAVRRFWGVVDPTEPRHDPGYARLLWRFATAPPDPQPSPALAENLRVLRAIRECPFRSEHAASSCGCNRCGLRGGAQVNFADCRAC